jgi:hypothetical protein
MKIQTGDMLIQDMGLKLGEIFQIGDGPNAFLMRYEGHDGPRGPCDCDSLTHGKWDRLTPVKTHASSDR